MRGRWGKKGIFADSLFPLCKSCAQCNGHFEPVTHGAWTVELLSMGNLFSQSEECALKKKKQLQKKGINLQPSPAPTRLAYERPSRQTIDLARRPQHCYNNCLALPNPSQPAHIQTPNEPCRHHSNRPALFFNWLLMSNHKVATNKPSSHRSWTLVLCRLQLQAHSFLG